MFNYQALNDVEFENLCKDVMERVLSVKLRNFTKGRDGGIDMADNTLGNNVLVQVKHYIRSTFSDLRTSLRKEQVKVNKKKPNQYYICCGMTLTADNINEVYTMFSDYMDSDRNVMTLIEIDEFLQKEENADIVRKHYKLWLHASGILNEVYNLHIFIDCEALFSNIKEEADYFVKTTVYDDCLECLDKNRMIFIVGHPGIGKTMTSKMLLLHYAEQGYAVRYTTNGRVKDIKDSLSLDRTAKEIVLLDDCLGQYYFSMKENQEAELTALIDYVKIHENKKIILNSRVTVLNEAKERSDVFNVFMKSNKISKYVINMDTLHPIEKAEIFYNHLISKNLPPSYYDNIKSNENYFKIVSHSNYTPRIIEFATLEFNWQDISSDNYAEYIVDSLNNPNDIWKNEYTHRMENVDRIFLNTLFSLTDTSIDSEVLKNCYNARIAKEQNIDSTKNAFDTVLGRLNQSMIKITDNRGKKHISTINPSVNDFLKSTISNNIPETSTIINTATNILQIEKLLKGSDFTQHILDKLNDGTILELEFSTTASKLYFITSNICTNELTDSKYANTIDEYLNTAFECVDDKFSLLSHNEILEKLLNEPFFDFYKVINIFTYNDLKELFRYAVHSLEKFIDTVNILTAFFERNKNLSLDVDCDVLFKELLQDAIFNYPNDISISEFCSSYDIKSLLKNNVSRFYYGQDYEEEYDIDNIVDTIKDMIIDDVYKEITDLLVALVRYKSTDFDIISDDIAIYTYEIESIVKSCITPDGDDDYYRENSHDSANAYRAEISIIFDRH